MQDDNNSEVEINKTNKLAVLGYILVGIAILDFSVSWVGIDLYGLVGINLPGVLYDNSPLIIGAIGALIIYYFKDSKEVEEEFTSNLKDGEEVIDKYNTALKHGIFKTENGTLIISNKRIKYTGTMATQGNVKIGSKDFEFLPENIKEVKATFVGVKITDIDGINYKLLPGFWNKNKLYKNISSFKNGDK